VHAGLAAWAEAEPAEDCLPRRVHARTRTHAVCERSRRASARTHAVGRQAVMPRARAHAHARTPRAREHDMCARAHARRVHARTHAEGAHVHLPRASAPMGIETRSFQMQNESFVLPQCCAVTAASLFVIKL
jgi:hypothetical protein